MNRQNISLCHLLFSNNTSSFNKSFQDPEKKNLVGGGEIGVAAILYAGVAGGAAPRSIFGNLS